MTPETFRRLALALEGAVEGAHMGHPDFRIDGRIFASLGPPGSDYGTAMLAPEEQEAFLANAPEVFEPSSGAWGRAGATKIHLKDAPKSAVAAALKMAWSRKKKVKKKK